MNSLLIVVIVVVIVVIAGVILLFPNSPSNALQSNSTAQNTNQARNQSFSAATNMKQMLNISYGLLSNISNINMSLLANFSIKTISSHATSPNLTKVYTNGSTSGIFSKSGRLLKTSSFGTEINNISGQFKQFNHYVLMSFYLLNDSGYVKCSSISNKSVNSVDCPYYSLSSTGYTAYLNSLIENLSLANVVQGAQINNSNINTKFIKTESYLGYTCSLMNVSGDYVQHYQSNDTYSVHIKNTVCISDYSGTAIFSSINITSEFIEPGIGFVNTTFIENLKDTTISFAPLSTSALLSKPAYINIT